MSGTIKWGILGLGKIAHKFASDLILIKGCKLKAVASSSEDRAKAFANKYGLDTFYGSYNNLYEDELIDIIYIASLNQNHHGHVIQAIKHGKAVLCEKPLAINYRQAKDMMNCARLNQVFLMEALWTRFNPTFEQILRWINEGRIGKLRYINATFSFNGLNNDSDSRLFNPAKGGGSLLDIGIYPLFLSLSILGKPNNIKALAVLSETGVDEQIGMLLNYNQSQAILYSSYVHNEDMRATICGEKGEIYLESRWHETSNLKLVQKGNIFKKKFNFIGKGYVYEIEEANWCLRNKKLESTKWSLQNSLDLVELMDQIRKQTGIQYPMD
jgi:predicted dehydrogenase